MTADFEQGEYRCYTDGSCKAGDSMPGGWGYCIYTPSGEVVEKYGKTFGQIAKIVEYRAVAEALTQLPEGATATVYCDNQSLIENMSNHLGHWAARGFTKVDPEIVDIVQIIADQLVTKQLLVKWQWVRSHNGNEGNERADALATQGARQAKEEVNEKQKSRAKMPASPRRPKRFNRG